MNRLKYFLLFSFIILAFSGCRVANSVDLNSSEEYYCVVNADNIGFYTPATKSCERFGDNQESTSDFCNQIEKLYQKGECTLKKEACRYGRGEHLFCVNNNKQSFRIMLTPKKKD